MNRRFYPALAALALAGTLGACSKSETKTENADDYAARIGGQQPGTAAQGAAAAGGQPSAGSQAAPPAVASPDGSRGQALAAGSESCNAPAAASFINQTDTPQVRNDIARAVGGGVTLRFMPPGTSGQIGSQNTRLNVMVDYTGVIRDLRCG